MNQVKFPINSYEINFIAIIIAITAYTIGSFATYKPFDLDKLLHRGKWSDGHVVPKQDWSFKHIFKILVNITPDYTLGDKIIAWSVFCYSIVYGFFIMFLIPVIWNAISPWPNEWFKPFFLIRSLVIPMIIGVISTVWFIWGGLRDGIQLFKDLDKRVSDPNDNGLLATSSHKDYHAAGIPDAPAKDATPAEKPEDKK